jgi:hypothetical protein
MNLRRQTCLSTASTKPATVSASAWAAHFDCGRAYIGRLEAEGMIQWQGGGSPEIPAA